MGDAFVRSTASNRLGSLLVLCCGICDVFFSESMRRNGSSKCCGGPCRLRCQWEWKCSSRRTPSRSSSAFSVWLQGKPHDFVNVSVQSSKCAGGFLSSNLRCSSTFLSASCEIQPRTALYNGPESSIGVLICCFAWFDVSSASWLSNACLIALHASKRSSVDFLKWALRSAWIPSTREVATLPKCEC